MSVKLKIDKNVLWISTDQCWKTGYIPQNWTVKGLSETKLRRLSSFFSPWRKSIQVSVHIHICIHTYMHGYDERESSDMNTRAMLHKLGSSLFSLPLHHGKVPGPTAHDLTTHAVCRLCLTVEVWQHLDCSVPCSFRWLHHQPHVWKLHQCTLLKH